MRNAVIRVSRGKERFRRFAKLRLWVDGTVVGVVPWNRTADVSLAPGTHTVRLQLGAFQSKPQEIRVGAGEPAAYRVVVPTGWGTLLPRPERCRLEPKGKP